VKCKERYDQRTMELEEVGTPGNVKRIGVFQARLMSGMSSSATQMLLNGNVTVM
jgi:hypothetical protein